MRTGRPSQPVLLVKCPYLSPIEGSIRTKNRNTIWAPKFGVNAESICASHQHQNGLKQRSHAYHPNHVHCEGREVRRQPADSLAAWSGKHSSDGYSKEVVGCRKAFAHFRDMERYVRGLVPAYTSTSVSTSLS